jgi:hypothetical protein
LPQIDHDSSRRSSPIIAPTRSAESIVNLADTGTGPRSNTGQSDEAFKRSIESLSRLLASRPVPPLPPSPEIEFFAPRDEAAAFRRRSLPAVLLLVAAIAAVSAGVYSFLQGAVPPQESHKVETVPAATVSPPPAVARPAPSIATILPPPVDTAPVSSADVIPPKPIVVSLPLDAHGISELQTRLGRLGFSPGPVDGVAGRMTAAAIKRYQQSRGRPLTTAVDDDLLDQLRKEPAR